MPSGTTTKTGKRQANAAHTVDERGRLVVEARCPPVTFVFADNGAGKAWLQGEVEGCDKGAIPRLEVAPSTAHSRRQLARWLSDTVWNLPQPCSAAEVDAAFALHALVTEVLFGVPDEYWARYRGQSGQDDP